TLAPCILENCLVKNVLHPVTKLDLTIRIVLSKRKQTLALRALRAIPDDVYLPSLCVYDERSHPYQAIRISGAGVTNIEIVSKQRQKSEWPFSKETLSLKQTLRERLDELIVKVE
ncbi:MAG: hypothetical protein AAFY26_27645, partial [Cyanobacteria bacterium J06638_22]